MYRKAIINISVRIGNRYSTINGALMALVGDQSALGSGVIYYSHHMPPSLPPFSLLSFPFSSLLSRFPFFPSLINGVFCYEAGRIRLGTSIAWGKRTIGMLHLRGAGKKQQQQQPHQSHLQFASFFVCSADVSKLQFPISSQWLWPAYADRRFVIWLTFHWATLRL